MTGYYICAAGKKKISARFACMCMFLCVCVCVIPMAAIKPVVSEHVKCCRAAITGRNKYAVCVRAEHLLLCVFFRPHPPKLRATYIYALVKDSQLDKKSSFLLFQNVLFLPFSV